MNGVKIRQKKAQVATEKGQMPKQAIGPRYFDQQP
jgi:hypothetical protein